MKAFDVEQAVRAVRTAEISKNVKADEALVFFREIRS